MTGKKLYARSMFMILLILTLPFYISNAYAQATQLTVTRHSGDAGVNGFFDGYDRWLLEATASIEDDDEITTDQVKINTYDLQNCSESSPPGTFKCTYASAYYMLAGGTYASTVNLFADNGNLVASKNINMTLDNLAPVIEFTRLPLQNASIVSVAYNIKDRAWQENDYSICSGIDRIEFWDNSAKLAEENMTNMTGCTYSGVTNVPLPSTGNLIIKAFDRMGHATAESSPQFELDISPPSVQTDTFKMISQGVELQEYIPAGTFPVRAQIRIIENRALKPQNIFADFSQFGAGSSVPALECTQLGGEYTCTWQTLQLTITSGTYNIKITAKDDVGNTQEATVVKSFTVDTTAPNIIQFGTRNPFNNIHYIGSVPKDIVAMVSETGAGMAARQAVIDISEIDLSYKGKFFQPNKCEKIGANWECVWEGVKSDLPDGARGNFFISKMFDDAGNEAGGITQASFIIDQKPPEVQELSEEQKLQLTGTEAGAKYYAMFTPVAAIPTPVISSGDDITVSVLVKDDSEVNAIGDFSRIMGTSGYEKAPGTCTTEDNENWNCTWEIGPVGSGYLKELVDFTFTDSAGNNETVSQKVEVYAKSFEENPDYWTASLKSTMPATLDRSTTALINHKMFFQLYLASSTTAGLVSVELGECTENAGFADSVYIFNNERGNQNPMIGIVFKPFEAAFDTLDIECNLHILSTYQKKLTTNYEVEPVNLTVQFYDMPLGEASASLQDKIEDEIDDYIDSGFWEVIGFLNKIFQWCDILCRGYYTVRMIEQVFNLIGSIFQKIEATNTPYASQVAYLQRQGFCLKQEAVKSQTDRGGKIANTPENRKNSWAAFFDKFCGFINCKYGPLPEGGSKEGLGYWAKGGCAEAWNKYYDTLLGPSYKQAIGGVQGTEDYTRAMSTGGYMNVKDNIVLSVVCLCLPGIIYNLNKIRAIHCEYVGCLAKSVVLGISTGMCEDTKDYKECKYIWGAIFQLVPFAAFADYILRLLRNAVSDPMALLGVVFAAGCVVHCPTYGGWGHKLCMFVKLMSTVGDIISNIEAISSPDAWSLKSDPCVAIEEHVDEIKRGDYSGLMSEKIS